jgi:hypothetical protein
MLCQVVSETRIPNDEEEQPEHTHFDTRSNRHVAEGVGKIRLWQGEVRDIRRYFESFKKLGLRPR